MLWYLVLSLKVSMKNAASPHLIDDQKCLDESNSLIDGQRMKFLQGHCEWEVSGSGNNVQCGRD